MPSFLHPLQFACIFVRTCLAAVAFYIANVAQNARLLRLMAILLLIPAIVMFGLWAFGARQNALESLERGGRTWWNDMRPVHALLYFGFSALVLSSPSHHHLTSPQEHAYALLLADAGIGAGAFLASRQHQQHQHGGNTRAEGTGTVVHHHAPRC